MEILYDAFKNISENCRFNDVMSMGNNIDSKNSSNDIQKEIDIYANNRIIEAVKKMDNVIGYISEEDSDMILTNTSREKGYLVIFDPLDGSKNVYSNITVGTIYGIYEYDVNKDNIISIIETGYCLYGPSTILVKTDNGSVSQYELNKKNDFIFKRQLTLPKNNDIYSINMSYTFDKDIETMIRHIKVSGCTQRWIGAMVADCHQILVRGGTFIYPRTNMNPNGKIRLLYEAIPIAYLFECMNGTAIDMNLNKIINKLKYIKLKEDKIHGEIPIIMSTYYSKKEITDILDLNDIIKC